MASINQSLNRRDRGTSASPAMTGRERIVAAASQVLKFEPENFSVQRVARNAGLSARAVYGHFSSGAELASTTRLLTLQRMINKLRLKIDDDVSPRVALTEFAKDVAGILTHEGAAWMVISRRDADFRNHYHRAVWLPLVEEVMAYLAKRRPSISAEERQAASEIFVTTIESLAFNYDPSIEPKVELGEALDWLVSAFCSSNSLEAV